MNDNHLLAKIGQYAIIKNLENKVLLLERTRSKTWCLPGGRLNENEEWDVALLREIKEELNLECQNPTPFAVNIIKDEYQTKYCVYFNLDCPDLSTLETSDEHSNLGWFDIEEIKNLNIEDNKIKKVIISCLSNT
ncbi:MAG: NUDIX hydrolase [Candidatus Saccharibacteria bacterium]